LTPLAKQDHSLRGRLSALDGALPRKTWPSLIRLLRARKKRTGEAPQFVTGHGELQRALDFESRREAKLVWPDIERLHSLLKGMHVAKADDPQAQDRAAQVDQLLQKLTPRIREEPLEVVITGWHPSIPQAIRDAVLGRSEASLGEMSPVDAAVLHHELAGLNLGGSRLRVRPVLFKQEVLPPAPRNRRAGPQRRDREGSWLPHTDDVGQWSATPWAIAQKHAAILAEAGSTEVIDLFCGCGADAIGFAERGLDVWACEVNAGRAALAFRNVAMFEVKGRVDVTRGDGLALLESLQAKHPGAALYVDPPWGSAEAQKVVAREALTWTALLGSIGGQTDILLEHEGPLLLKLPRDFDLETLPEPNRWTLQWNMGTSEQNAERIVKTISAFRG